MSARHSNRGWPKSKPPVMSFGEDRTCAAPGCETKLSRYNPDDWCFAHRDQVPPRPINHRQHP